MEVDLKLKSFRQPKSSRFCGPYSMKMVFKYFGIRLRMQHIKEYGRCWMSGILDGGIALGLHQAGLNPKLYVIPDGDPIWGKYAILSKKKVILSEMV